MWKRGIKVIRVSDKENRSANEQIVMVKPFVLKINNHITLTTNITPKHEKELILGYIASKNLISDFEELPEIIKTNEEYSVEIPENVQSDPIMNLTDSFSLTANHIFALSAYFQEAAFLYKDTSISHSAAIASSDKLLDCCEDIHLLNAVDKVIGCSLQKKIDFSKTALLISGKITETLVKKALTLKIPIIISRFAPTDRAYDLANNKKLTLVGFCRGKRFSIYTEKQRIIVKP